VPFCNMPSRKYAFVKGNFCGRDQKHVAKVESGEI
jgi:hypothetical protein